MSFKTEKKVDYSLITFSTDKLDAIVAPDLKAELVLISKNDAKNIIIDLSSVKYCDSSGLSSLLVAYRLCNTEEGSFVLFGIQPAVEKLFSISQLDTIFKIANNIEEATEMLYTKQIEE